MRRYKGNDTKNFKSVHDRYKIADQLERNGYLKIGNDELTLLPGHLVQVKGNQTPQIDNPMTWDTFVHLYLIGK